MNGAPLPLAVPQYTQKVSFDVLDSEYSTASMLFFTLQAQSEGYKRSRHTRVFLCALSADESGREALAWAIDSLVQDGDELVVFRGVDRDQNEPIKEEMREVMKYMQRRSIEIDPERQLSLVLECIPGNTTDSLGRLIALYRPDSVVIGSRGRMWPRMWEKIGFIGVGNTSRYCLSLSPIPVIVVPQKGKAREMAGKRKANSKRRLYFE